MDLDTSTRSLIVRAKLGNKESLNKLFAQHQAKILRIVRFRLKPDIRQKLKLQSFDVVQEVFMYALEHLKDFEPKSQGHFYHWLSKKVEHCIYDKLDYASAIKRTAPGGEVSLDQTLPQRDEANEMKIQIEDDGTTPSQFAVIEERKALVDSLLEKLEPEDREVIIHRKYEELTFKEIGEMYSKSEEATRKQYARAFKKLVDLSHEKLQPIIQELTFKKFENGF